MILFILCLISIFLLGLLKIDSNFAHAIEILYGIYVTGNVGAKYSHTTTDGGER